MAKTNNIEHFGTILKIDNEHITVGVVNVSACAGCHAKGACSMADMKEKTVDVIDYSNQFSVGEKVNLKYQESLGWFALMIAYVIPFIVVIITLVVALTITADELISGLIALAILVPYYVVLSFYKKKLKKTFSFSIEKIVKN